MLCTALPTRLAIGPRDYPHNSEIDLRAVGPGGHPPNAALACFIPDPSTAEWYFPNGSVVPLGPSSDNFISYRGQTNITLNRQNNSIYPTGRYCCGSITLPVEQRLCITLKLCKYLLYDIVPRLQEISDHVTI